MANKKLGPHGTGKQMRVGVHAAFFVQLLGQLSCVFGKLPLTTDSGVSEARHSHAPPHYLGRSSPGFRYGSRHCGRVAALRQGAPHLEAKASLLAPGAVATRGLTTLSVAAGEL